MNYIIYDLEFNQKYNISSDNITTDNFKANDFNDMPFEIIQIGAIKLTETFETISTFNSLVKPTLYKNIHPYIETLTKITDAKVESCKNFIEVYEDFLKFVTTDDIILCVWGVTDIKELLRNMQFYNLTNLKFFKYIDIQKYASKYLNTPNKSKIGLKNAIELLNIPVKGEFHDAFNDAYYTAEVFKLIYNSNIKPSIFVPSPARRVLKPKEKIDIVSLINQFEKMYNREMSEEEKSIIKTAYMMGKTKQFIL